MVFDTTQFDKDMAVTVADLPEQFTHKGNNYNAVITDINDLETFAMEGVFEDAEFIIHVQNSLFAATPPFPIVGNEVTVNAKNFRILEIKITPDDVEVQLVCGALTE